MKNGMIWRAATVAALTRACAVTAQTVEEQFAEHIFAKRERFDGYSVNADRLQLAAQ